MFTMHRGTWSPGENPGRTILHTCLLAQTVLRSLPHIQVANAGAHGGPLTSQTSGPQGVQDAYGGLKVKISSESLCRIRWSGRTRSFPLLCSIGMSATKWQNHIHSE